MVSFLSIFVSILLVVLCYGIFHILSTEAKVSERKRMKTFTTLAVSVPTLGNYFPYDFEKEGICGTRNIENVYDEFFTDYITYVKSDDDGETFDFTNTLTGEEIRSIHGRIRVVSFEREVEE